MWTVLTFFLGALSSMMCYPIVFSFTLTLPMRVHSEYLPIVWMINVWLLSWIVLCAPLVLDIKYAHNCQTKFRNPVMLCKQNMCIYCIIEVDRESTFCRIKYTPVYIVHIRTSHVSTTYQNTKYLSYFSDASLRARTMGLIVAHA